MSQSHRNLTIDGANTDLVERFTRGLPLTEADPATFYAGGAKGYTDYKTFDQMMGELKTCQRWMNCRVPMPRLGPRVALCSVNPAWPGR